MYIYANSELVVSKGSVIAEVYQEYREDDFFLYLGYYEENVYADIGRESWFNVCVLFNFHITFIRVYVIIIVCVDFKCITFRECKTSQILRISWNCRRACLAMNYTSPTFPTLAR